MFSLSRQEKIVFLLIVFILLAVFGWKIFSKGRNTITIIPSTGEGEIASDQETEKITDESFCIVHISGAVSHPGVYQLEEGDRVIDAVTIAGGALEKANLDAVNLAARICDGQKIVIPFVLDNAEMLLNSTNRSNPEYQKFNSGVDQNSDLININTAPAVQLENLPGIGTVLANQIVEYRERNGMFRSIEEVMNVPGIGEKKFESIREHISVY
ncbi:MAG: helix-hairpin-helix domain-containing protein [Candidatus Atribacteria bacterium]|nr:helix-hairpin-helix domain-containing protein [Candidatus Atribacteria bacterium]